jgi:hypothetical protein
MKIPLLGRQVATFVDRGHPNPIGMKSGQMPGFCVSKPLTQLTFLQDTCDRDSANHQDDLMHSAEILRIFKPLGSILGGRTTLQMSRLLRRHEALVAVERRERRRIKSSSRLNGEPGCFPLGETILQPPDAVALLTEGGHCFE